AGTWDMEIRVRPLPGAEPLTTRTTAENRMILGGRFLESRAAVDMFGMSGETLTILGFDRRHGTYTSIGLDTFGTYWVTAAGKPDAASGAIVMRGEDVDPVAGHRQVYEFHLEIVDEDRYVFAVVFLDDAHTRGQGPFRMLEITHTRRKS
ncbi:MAG: DUF1579 domain-containing protein, partial [Gemmatimonadetes bacterium]|nr:DUF1579 domain-containing protein [Gemmatimonadota bacterium]